MRPSLAEPGAETLTRDEVLEALDQSHRVVEARVAQDSAEKFGEWSAKELLFHLASWQRFFAATLRARREAGRDATASEMLGWGVDSAESERVLALDTDQTNAYVQELYRDAGWAEARSYWAESCDLLRGEVARLSDQQLAEGQPLWQQIGGESFTHIPMHVSAPEQTVG